MAKTFGGFTPQQQQTLLSKMGYTGPAQQDDLNKYMMSSPKAASMMGKYAQMAKARVEGGPTVGMAAGGDVAPPKTIKVSEWNEGRGQYVEVNAPNPAYQEWQANMANSTTPNTTGGFDMSEAASTVQTQEPTVVYDPTTGLPTSVDVDSTVTSLIESNPEQYYVNQVDYENNKKFAVDQTKALSGNEAIMADPDAYEIERRGNRYYIVYPDGTAINTGYNGLANAEARAKGVAAGLKSVKPLQDTYNQQLDIYKQYQSEQATTKAETPVFENIDAAQAAVNTRQNVVANYQTELAGLPEDDPRRDVLKELINEEQIKLNQAKAGLMQSQQRAASERDQQRMKATTEFEADPSGQATRADVATISQAQKEAGMIASGTGQAGETTDATLTTATAEGDVDLPAVKDAVKASLATATPDVKDTVSKLVAATGEPSEGALAKGAEMTPQELASLDLTVDQIEQATQVIAPERRTIQEGELVSGTAVDFERAKAETNFAAATGVPSSEATVQGQLTGLLEQFEGGETPPWAAGAMRAATATLAARGLGASSMAGQAVVQAAMESAMPIAMADAQTRASFEAQNLSNRQQAAMFAAEQRSKFLGMEFDQEFQARVQNAARIADVANQNFNADQQIALENARLTQTVNIANLDARNAKIMADAAAMSQVDITNLNNRQQAAIQYANSFLQMDMANLTNEQQAAMFKSQSIVQSLLSDTAAENAAEQFNATSENQTNQFYDSLTSQIQQFNVDQGNAMERFNAGEANALAQFNKQQEDRRAEFNAQQSLVVEQANAKWSQDIALTETAAINEANRDEARAANEMSLAAYEAQAQAERDKMSYAFQTANNNADRATEIAIQTMKTEASASSDAAAKSSALATAVGAVVANVLD